MNEDMITNMAYMSYITLMHLRNHNNASVSISPSIMNFYFTHRLASVVFDAYRNVMFPDGYELLTVEGLLSKKKVTHRSERGKGAFS